MLTVTVTATAAGHTVVVNVPQTTGEAETTAEDKGPSPIAPEPKELLWGGGAFLVLFVLMRVVLFPRLKKGMEARYGKIRGDHETAESVRAAAKAELAAYEAELAKVKAEARQRIDAARQTLESRTRRSIGRGQRRHRRAPRRGNCSGRGRSGRCRGADPDRRRRRQQSRQRDGHRSSPRSSGRHGHRDDLDGWRCQVNLVALLVGAAGGEHEDITQTPSKFWPEGYEMLFGIPASLLVFFLLWKFAGPTVKKAMTGRTAKIQAELDAGEADRVAAEAEAAQIRQALGDIASERARMLAEADAQAAALLEDGRARLAQEIAELEARAEADLAAAAGRVSDELACRDRPPVGRGRRARRHRLAR